MHNFFMLMVFSDSYQFWSNCENGGIIRSAFIVKLILRKCTTWRTWTSRHVYLNFTLFFHVLFLLVALHPLLVALHPLTGIEQVIYRWKAIVNTQLSRVDHFFILATVLKVFHAKFIQFSSWTSCCFHVELMWRVFVCNYLIHSSVLHKWYSFCTKLFQKYIF